MKDRVPLLWHHFEKRQFSSLYLRAINFIKIYVYKLLALINKILRLELKQHVGIDLCMFCLLSTTNKYMYIYYVDISS